MNNMIKFLSVIFTFASPLQAMAVGLELDHEGSPGAKEQGCPAYSLGAHSIAAIIRADIPVSKDEIPSHLLQQLRTVKAANYSLKSSPNLIGLIDSKGLLDSPLAMEAFFILNPEQKAFWLKRFMSEAITEGDLGGIQFLLNHGFDVKSPIFQSDKTALHQLACLNSLNHLKTATLLLKHGANPNQFDLAAHGLPVTPWMIAHGNRLEELAQLMIDFGADPEIGAKRHRAITQILEAAVNGDLEALRSNMDLPYQIRVDDSQVNGFTALMLASMHGHLDLVKYLVETRHANVFLTEQENHLTPYFLANGNGHTEIAEYLKQAGGGPPAPQRFNWVDDLFNRGQPNQWDGPQWF